MTLIELSDRLDKTISCYEAEAGKACSYCSDDYTGNALSASHEATAKALSAFKADILAYLDQL